MNLADMKQKKISVKHFLNKKLKTEDPEKRLREFSLRRKGKSKKDAQQLAKEESDEKGPFFKVYTRVNYKQKTTQFRSRIYDNVLSEFEFNQALKTKSGKVYEDIDRESNQIITLIRLTNSDANERFDISNLSSAYDKFRRSRIADLIIEEFEMEFQIALARSEFAPLRYNIDFEKSIDTLIQNLAQVCKNLNVQTNLDGFIHSFHERVSECSKDLKDLLGKDYSGDLYQFVRDKNNLKLLYSSEEIGVLILRKRLESHIGYLIDILSGGISDPRFDTIQQVVDEAIEKISK